ncbi:MAG: hypothetical protein ACXABY_18995 [Candidatus Thorarchaeota archaeon]|jgi:hypothetical protein
MALAPNRAPINGADTVRYALAEVAERGKLVCHVAGTTAAGEVTGLANPTGAATQVVGLLLDDVESHNFDRHGEYRQRNVVDVGSLVGIATKGEYETDLVVGTPVQGNPAYLHASGFVSATRLTDGITPAPLVGKFRSGLNANGFARVYYDV